MITFVPYPIPVIIKETRENAYVLYVESSKQFENYIWTIVKCEGGDVIHVKTNQIAIHNNSTFGIKKQN